MNDADTTAPAAAPVPPAAPRGRMTAWRWALLLALLCSVFTIVVAAWLLQAVSDLSGNGVHLTIDDDTVHLGSAHMGSALLAVCGVFAAVLAVLCVVPVVLALAFSAAALGIGVALLAVLAVAAVALSPLWLLIALLWWALRPARQRAAAVSSSA